MAEVMYKKIVDANGAESFVEVQVPETPAATPTANQEPKKSFWDTVKKVWQKLQPVLGGMLIGIGGTAAGFYLLGSKSSDVPPTLPGSGSNLGSGTGGTDTF